jgi:hypothetical protein
MGFGADGFQEANRQIEFVGYLHKDTSRENERL